MFKVNKRNTRTIRKICSKLTVKIQEGLHWSCFFVMINFEQISHNALVFLFATLKKCWLLHLQVQQWCKITKFARQKLWSRKDLEKLKLLFLSKVVIILVSYGMILMVPILISCSRLKALFTFRTSVSLMNWSYGSTATHLCFVVCFFFFSLKKTQEWTQPPFFAHTLFKISNLYIEQYSYSKREMGATETPLSSNKFAVFLLHKKMFLNINCRCLTPGLNNYTGPLSTILY